MRGDAARLARRHLLVALALLLQRPILADTPRLEVRLADGRVVWSAPTVPGERFDVAFTHSSERCRWVQHYIVGADRALRQTGSAFPCFGPGMPPTTSGRSADGYEAAAAWRLEAIRMMNWRPSRITLRQGGREWPIGEAMEDYARFEVRVR
jgi:hypothetical protein